MQEYKLLHAKLVNKTITKQEQKRLFDLAFGNEFMASNDKGTLKEYS
tara:strand:- start:4956 stop:5096 length:141 start_codon:yes stop_codon:yes gene_type:complete